MAKILEIVEQLKIQDWKRTELDWTVELELKLENGNCVYYILNEHEKALFKHHYYPLECMKVKRYCFSPYYAISKWEN